MMNEQKIISDTRHLRFTVGIEGVVYINLHIHNSLTNPTHQIASGGRRR